MKHTSEIKVEFDSQSENESFIRVVVSAFVARLDPNLEEISDIKTAVSEAVTNCIIHGYEGVVGKVIVESYIDGQEVTIKVIDNGVGIPDINQAVEPLYTSKPELERSGMGFAFMEAFMDHLKVESIPEKGTTITMKKTIGKRG